MTNKKDAETANVTNQHVKSMFEMVPSELFRVHAESPLTWLVQGVGLLRSSYRLWDVFWRRSEEHYVAAKGGRQPTEAEFLEMQCDSFVGAYMLLAGFAFENLIKGLVIIRQGLKCKDGKLAKPLQKHDLIALAIEEASLSLSDSEKRLLADLTKAVVWRGRYRTPAKQSDLSGKQPAMAYIQPFCHPQTATELFMKIMSEYPESSLAGMAFVERPDLADGLAALLQKECPEIRRLRDLA